MDSKLGTPLARQRSGHVYLIAAAGVAAVSAFGAFRGRYGWGVSEWAAGITVFLCVLPWLTPRRRENVQIDDTGVIVVTSKGRDEVHWDEVTSARIVTTSAGPWGEDVFSCSKAPEAEAAWFHTTPPFERSYYRKCGRGLRALMIGK